jgi:NADH:ubiquinone oxidoreductase subunit
MLADHMLCTIDGARTTELARLGSDISRAYANGALGEDDHQRLWEALEERWASARIAPAGERKSAPRASARRAPRSPDRQRSLDRRRRLSAASAMMIPPAVAARFTDGERAALYVVAQEVKLRGQCDLYIDQIAAFAGVGRSTCRNALREAKRLDMIRIDERRLSARYNDANRITIVSPEWRAWLIHRKETVKNPKPTHQPGFQGKSFARPGRYVGVAKPRKWLSEGGS